jgi:hypothetical protein
VYNKRRKKEKGYDHSRDDHWFKKGAALHPGTSCLSGPVRGQFLGLLGVLVSLFEILCLWFLK